MLLWLMIIHRSYFTSPWSNIKICSSIYFLFNWLSFFLCLKKIAFYYFLYLHFFVFFFSENERVDEEEIDYCCPIAASIQRQGTQKPSNSNSWTTPQQQQLQRHCCWHQHRPPRRCDRLHVSVHPQQWWWLPEQPHLRHHTDQPPPVQPFAGQPGHQQGEEAVYHGNPRTVYHGKRKNNLLLLIIIIDIKRIDGSRWHGRPVGVMVSYLRFLMNTKKYTDK